MPSGMLYQSFLPGAAALNLLPHSVNIRIDRSFLFSFFLVRHPTGADEVDMRRFPAVLSLVACSALPVFIVVFV